MSEKPAYPLTRLERLAALVRDDGVEPEAMTPDQLSQYLKDREVDISGPKKGFERLLKKAKARRALERAAQLRAQGFEKLKAGISGTTQGIRERVRAMIEHLGQNDPDQAKVYAHHFEKATEEDLATLEADLMLLEQLEKQDDEGDSPTRG